MRTQSEYVEAILQDSRGFAEAAEAAGPQAAVAACPDWTVADLVWHLREVQHGWGCVVAEALTDLDDIRQRIPQLERPAEFSVALADFRAGAEHFAEVLAAADPGVPVWTWAPQHDVAFVLRYQPQEAAVHRWDAEQAAGRDFHVDPVMAADGIDHFLSLVGVTHQPEGAAALGGTVHLHATDTPGEWLVAESSGGEARVTREHRKADAALRATASDLLLMLYHRVGPDRGKVFGDPAVLDRLFARRVMS